MRQRQQHVRSTEQKKYFINFFSWYMVFNCIFVRLLSYTFYILCMSHLRTWFTVISLILCQIVGLFPYLHLRNLIINIWSPIRNVPLFILRPADTHCWIVAIRAMCITGWFEEHLWIWWSESPGVETSILYTRKKLRLRLWSN